MEQGLRGASHRSRDITRGFVMSRKLLVIPLLIPRLLAMISVILMLGVPGLSLGPESAKAFGGTEAAYASNQLSAAPQQGDTGTDEPVYQKEDKSSPGASPDNNAGGGSSNNPSGGSDNNGGGGGSSNNPGPDNNGG